ncbi:MAG TPA: N-acetyltransferase [Acidimicrobiia bacterium]|nr:N-acetyltransferase [Acidimicrobiia bacterium]
MNGFDIRQERAGDEPAITAIHAAAFRRPDQPDVEPPEAQLVTDLRAGDAWIPELSIVAVDGDTIVGHVVCTRATIARSIPVLGLGPIGVVPARQGHGIGIALVRAALATADARGERLVALLGSPAYYSRFGFGPASAHGIEPPREWYGEDFQVFPLTAATGTERGKFAYAKPFDQVP